MIDGKAISISLFAGAFGLDLGIEKAGFHTISVVEKDRDATKTIAGGGEACIKHFVLRLILYFNGSIPWNYARFLDWATERIFLQKVGGGYIFIHRLLLEHFAKM